MFIASVKENIVLSLTVVCCFTGECWNKSRN